MTKETSGPVVFLSWRRGDGDVVRLMTQQFEGQMLVHLHTYSPGANGQFYPTTRGVTIPHGQLVPLRKALRKIGNELDGKEDHTKQMKK